MARHHLVEGNRLRERVEEEINAAARCQSGIAPRFG